MKYGLKLDPIVPEKDFILGGYGSIGGDILAPDGQWDQWLPENEVQNKNGIEPEACVSFATLNCVEILERQEYGVTQNWSDRFLATASGTAAFHGNTPHAVAETLRKKGCVEEKYLPFDVSIDTYDKFYTDIPKSLYMLALEFFAQYDFAHEYVNPNAKDLMEALKRSPVVFTAYAWVQDQNGLYYKPEGAQDNHATVCYGYKEGEYWKIFDSYFADGIVLKKVRWDALPMQAKRFTLHRPSPDKSLLSRLIKRIREIFGL